MLLCGHAQIDIQKQYAQYTNHHKSPQQAFPDCIYTTYTYIHIFYRTNVVFWMQISSTLTLHAHTATYTLVSCTYECFCNKKKEGKERGTRGHDRNGRGTCTGRIHTHMAELTRIQRPATGVLLHASRPQQRFVCLYIRPYYTHTYIHTNIDYIYIHIHTLASRA